MTKKQPRIKISHNKNIFFVLIAVSVFFVLLLILTFAYSRIFPDNPRIYECLSDQDCIKQETSCCSCRMGGNEICMSARNATLWKEKLANSCQDNLICPALFNCNNLECRCINGKCSDF